MTPCLTLVLALAAAAPTADATWPQWRGPNRDGAAPGGPWPANLAEDTLTKLWESEKLGPSYSGPIVSASTVFTTETVDKKTEVVTAFDRATGKVRWKQQWDGAMTVPFFAKANGDWIRSTPAFDGEALYVAGIRDKLVKLDAATGEVKWTVDCTTAFGTKEPSFGCVCSPLVDDQAVYMQAATGFIKVDKKTGKVAWRVLTAADDPMTGSAFSSPVFATFGGKSCALVQTRTELAAVDKDTGSVMWKRAVPSFRGMNILTPIVYNDGVFTSTYGGNTQMIKVAGTAAEGFAIKDGWSFKYEGNMSTPVVVDGHAYLLGKDQKLVCVDLATGNRTWTSDKSYGKYWSLVYNRDKILALDQRGVLYLLKANAKEPEILAERKVATDSWAHLAVVNDLVVVRSLDKLTVYKWATK